MKLQQTCSSMLVQEELQRTQFLVSEDSLQHSAEYHSRLDVLKELNYVDANGTRNRLFIYPFLHSFSLSLFSLPISFILSAVQMKGKVACEMGNHELIITELGNFLTLFFSLLNLS
jgi:antiviral helicase SKI2